MPKSKKRIPTPEFVDKIVTDPKKNANVLLLTGIPRRALEKEHTRLYFDAQLSRYVEIPDKAILHFQPVGPENNLSFHCGPIRQAVVLGGCGRRATP